MFGAIALVTVSLFKLVEAQTAECAPYYYAPAGSAIASFPTIWQPATIVQNDAAATQKWASIQPGLPPNISPRGTITGDVSNVTYAADDPACWWSYGKCTTPKFAGLPPDVASVSEPRTMGIGFDDGPNCSHNAFYDYLLEQEQKATMFYIGSNVMDWPKEAIRGITDGHEICVHTWSHRYMTALSSDSVFAELYYTIKLITGVTPTCWRPPFGDIDDRVRYIAHSLGLTSILWKYDSNDWKAGTDGVTPQNVDANYESFAASAKSGTFDTIGAIMLTHEINNYTMSEMIKYYPLLKSSFDHLVPVGVALNKTQPYVETNYTQPNFAQYVSGTVDTTGTPTPAGPIPSGTDSASPSGSPNAPGSSGNSASPRHDGAFGFAVLAALLGVVAGL